MVLTRISKRLREVLDSAAPGKVEKAILFGSRVKGNPSPDSDLDILIIVKGSCDWNLKKTILLACYTINLEFDVVTDIKIHGNDELAGPGGRQKYILNALQYGVAA